jgi:glycerol-3-phosphate dehydrogenase
VLRDSTVRSRALTRAAAESFDVVVVGTGLSAALLTLDSASRGCRTVLVSPGDIVASDSIAARTRVISRGPTRQGLSPAARSARRDRALLGRLAPHLARPATLTLNGHGVGTATIYDEGRLIVALLRTAALRHGAVVVHHAGTPWHRRDRLGNVVGISIARSKVEGSIDIEGRVVIDSSEPNTTAGAPTSSTSVVVALNPRAALARGTVVQLDAPSHTWTIVVGSDMAEATLDVASTDAASLPDPLGLLSGQFDWFDRTQVMSIRHVNGPTQPLWSARREAKSTIDVAVEAAGRSPGIWRSRLTELALIGASETAPIDLDSQVRFALDHEFAVTAKDIALRRLDPLLGHDEHAVAEAVQRCATLSESLSERLFE